MASRRRRRAGSAVRIVGDAYATAGVPVYVIADPYTGRCIAYTKPEDGEYTEEVRVPFGTDLDLTKTPLDLVLKTDGFPRH